jgi:hypothetical protein
VPWIDESLHPDTGEWVTRATLHERRNPNRDRGRDYNHSTFCDLVITGLAGLRPRADDQLEVDPLVPPGRWKYYCLDRVCYHGHLLTILFDETGEHYGRGAGLRVYVDGAEVACAPALRQILVPLTPPAAAAPAAAGLSRPPGEAQDPGDRRLPAAGGMAGAESNGTGKEGMAETGTSGRRET